MKRPAYEPILITDARRSQHDELHGRMVRYVVMMGIRTVCLVVGAILVTVDAPLLWLWLPLCAVGAILLPWLAVLLANDGPPKEENRLRVKLGIGRRKLAAQPPPRTLATEEEPRVIDLEP
ncbi:DUF3099 domain-containing protein [Melissospora conviva]|uniref:DUF3099 domain-containing protein n=1 Tax=Melissospora conviva TaxID=3388432 RepID=UPI003B77D495